MGNEESAADCWSKTEAESDDIDLIYWEDNSLEKLKTAVSGASFEQWYKERQFARNIREGQPYFNGPGRIKPLREQNPSQLLQCQRKTIYKQLKAPEETEDPTGIFWIGSRVEEDLILPYLDEAVARDEHYVTNSLWIEFDVETPAGEVQIKGSTDPVIVNSSAEPVLPFEVKTKRSVDQLHEPNRHHRAQVHAYLKGLTKKYDRVVKEAVIIYIGRSEFNVQTFTVEFDEEFWDNSVLPWIGDITAYRLEDDLPPADPQFDWECEYCSYRERCGKGEREFEDSPTTGLLPLFEYPRAKLVDYLEIHDEAKLTPTLAHLYPSLVAKHDVHDWRCRGCSAIYDYDEIDWDVNSNSPPKCPNCIKNDTIRLLSGPGPEEQSTKEGVKDA